MDPLSVSASLIAVIGAATSAVKGLDQLRRSLRDASTDICSLINEVSDLQVVLAAIEAAFTGWQNTHGSPSLETPLSNGFHILDRAKDQLQLLNNVVSSFVEDSERVIKPSRTAQFRWVREKRKIKRIQHNIYEAKNELAVLLGAHNL
jgi:hypothetical protein